MTKDFEDADDFAEDEFAEDDFTDESLEANNHSKQHVDIWSMAGHTVDGRNPAPPGMYETL